MSFEDRLNGEKIEILVVEDSPTQAIQLQQFLEQNGFAASVAYNGTEALFRIQEKMPRLIISDVIMPEMDGYELCRRIKSDEQLKKIPFILLTTLSDPQDILKGLENGTDNFVTKPYDEKVLLSRIRYILVNQEIRKNQQMDVGIDIFFRGKRHFINSNRIQILDLLLATYEHAFQQKKELDRKNLELKKASETIKKLEGIIPICAACKRIRDENGGWHSLEKYISDHSEAAFSHGICPECEQRLYPDTE